MEVWVPWRDTELLLELPGEALVDLMDPPEPDPSSVRNDPLTDRNFPVALLDVTFASPGSIGTLVRRCPAEETYVISWADLESPSSGTELRRAAEPVGRPPAIGRQQPLLSQPVHGSRSSVRKRAIAQTTLTPKVLRTNSIASSFVGLWPLGIRDLLILLLVTLSPGLEM